MEVCDNKYVKITHAVGFLLENIRMQRKSKAFWIYNSYVHELNEPT